MNQIGLKLADGSFYPVLEEGISGRKRLILTTVRDNQDTVQIDLYRGEGVELESAEYLGTLSIETIQAAPKNDPEIELVLGLDDQGTLEASAVNLLGGERRSLSVALAAGAGEGQPTFELEREGAATRVKRDSEELQEGLLTGETYPIGPGDRRKEHLHRRKRRPLLLVAFVVLALLLIAAIAFVVFRSVDGRRIPPLLGGRQASEAASGAAAGEEQPAAGTPQGAGASGPASSTAVEGASSPPAEGASSPAVEPEKKTPLSTPSGGVWYSIKRGDTLWDIAATYYRNPWLYPKIARANEIVNPDLIFAGSKLFIPEP